MTENARLLYSLQGLTFTAIVLRGRDAAGAWTYFRYPDHGGPVADPIYAHRCQVSPSLLDAEAAAGLSYPGTSWERARLIVDVLPFDGSAIDAMNQVIRGQVRREAIGKLTDLEREVLGLGGAT